MANCEYAVRYSNARVHAMVQYAESMVKLDNNAVFWVMFQEEEEEEEQEQQQQQQSKT
jgi:hypothetical protein